MRFEIHVSRSQKPEDQVEGFSAAVEMSTYATAFRTNKQALDFALQFCMTPGVWNIFIRRNGKDLPARRFRRDNEGVFHELALALDTRTSVGSNRRARHADVPSRTRKK